MIIDTAKSLRSVDLAAGGGHGKVAVAGFTGVRHRSNGTGQGLAINVMKHVDFSVQFAARDHIAVRSNSLSEGTVLPVVSADEGGESEAIADSGRREH